MTRSPSYRTAPRAHASVGPRAGTACVLLACLAFACLPTAAQGQNPPAAQPSLPPPIQSSPSKAQASPVVDSIAAGSKPTPELKREKTSRSKRRHVAHHRRYAVPVDVERPALAGVLLAEPVPPPIRAPRPIVPMPAYFVDSLVSAFTIAPPPLVCRPARRDPDLPDPHLYREVPLACAPDID